MQITISRDKIRKIDIINVRGGITASQVYEKYRPDYMINLALYDMASGQNITYLKDEGVLSGYLFSCEGLGIKGDNEIVWSNLKDDTVRDFAAGSPILIKNGMKNIDWGNKYSQYVDGEHNRSAIGFNSKEVILYTSERKMSLERLANVLESKCDYAINCDGGGSCHLQKGNVVLTKSTRKNASWLLIFLKQEVKKMKICLDAGHGIETSGKRSPDGTLIEYEFNRDVTDRLKTILERHGIQVLLTCDDDHDIDLKIRCEYANANKADYFVSMHANAHKEYWTDANGWEVYIVGKGGKAEQLAKSIQKHSIPALGLKDRGVKVENFQVLRDTDMPAVLIEHGFYTNKEECEKLKDSTFRQKCAECDAKGILEYLGIEYKEAEDTNVPTKELVLTIGQKTYTANGTKKESDVAPKIENGRTLVPIYVLRDLGLTVEWKEDTKQVIVYKG